MMKCAVVRRGEPTSTNARAFRCHNSPRAECTSARSAMASTPTTPRAPLSPKLNLPPMTISPQVTRLDRVLDLVTSHEAQFRDQELRSVDVSRRVAALEVALGAGRGDGAEDERDVRSELEAAREAVRHLHLENRALRADVQGAFERARAETDEKIAAMKAGFKSVLQDVVDRVASQLDAARKSEFERAGRYASAAELAALSERVASHESARDASHADALRRIDDLSTDRDKQKRRMAKLIAHYNDVVAEPDGATRRIDGSEPTPHSRESRTDAAVETLARRLDEQAAETTALRERFRNLSAELDAARRENERLARVSDTVRHAHERTERADDVVETRARAMGGATGGERANASNPGANSANSASSSVVHLGFGAYASAEGVAARGFAEEARERSSAAAAERTRAAERAAADFDLFLAKMKRRVVGAGEEEPPGDEAREEA